MPQPPASEAACPPAAARRLVVCFVGRRGVGKTTLLRSLAPRLNTGTNPPRTSTVEKYDATLLDQQLIEIVDPPGFDSPDSCTSVFQDIETKLASTGVDIVVLCVAGDERLTDEEAASLRRCANELEKRGLEKRTVVAFTKSSGKQFQQQREHAYREAVPRAVHNCVWIQATDPQLESKEALLRYMTLVTKDSAEPGSFRVIQSSSSRLTPRRNSLTTGNSTPFHESATRDGEGKTWRQWMWERRWCIGGIALGVSVVTGVVLIGKKINKINVKINDMDSRIAALVATNETLRVQHQSDIERLVGSFQKSEKLNADRFAQLASLVTKQELKETIIGRAEMKWGDTELN